MKSPVLAGLALLAILAYLPTLNQPLLEDDYPNITQAQVYGPISGWHEMFGDAIFRVRATFYWLLYSVNGLFGMHPAAYYCATILLHILNTWLIYALGLWRPIGYGVAAWAAAFFAVAEGHQEAVMWLSGSTELLLFFFGALSLLCWIRYLDGDAARWFWYAGSALAFVFALASKESAVIFVPLLGLPLILNRAPLRKALPLVPFALLAVISAALILYTRAYSFRFQDGSFSLGAPFWLTWPRSLGRLLWFWGLLSLVLAFLWREWRVAILGLTWAGISLVPYSFLSYSTQIPSRQTYLASLGLAWLVGSALSKLKERYRAAVWAAVFGIVIAHNVGYLWIKKRAQFLERAKPTEELIAISRSARGPIYVQCFPRPRLVAEEAVRLATGRPPSELIWDAAKSRARHAVATFCYTERR